jgi:hypothetical protein
VAAQVANLAASGALQRQRQQQCTPCAYGPHDTLCNASTTACCQAHILAVSATCGAALLRALLRACICRLTVR